MTALWYPAAEQDEMADSGEFAGGPPRGVLHTTEGSSYAGALQDLSGSAPISLGHTAPRRALAASRLRADASAHRKPAH